MDFLQRVPCASSKDSYAHQIVSKETDLLRTILELKAWDTWQVTGLEAFYRSFYR